MSGGDDWAPGDLALCVQRAPIVHNHSHDHLRRGLRLGAIYTVGAIGLDGASLYLRDLVNPPMGFWASRFRKIRPHTPDAEDAETIRLLTGKPVRERVS